MCATRSYTHSTPLRFETPSRTDGRREGAKERRERTEEEEERRKRRRKMQSLGVAFVVNVVM